MLRWEILEIIERDSVLVTAILYRPLGQAADNAELPFAPGSNAAEILRAVLFDGFEPISQAVLVMPDGALQKHWTFRLQVLP